MIKGHHDTRPDPWLNHISVSICGSTMLTPIISILNSVYRINPLISVPRAYRLNMRPLRKKRKKTCKFCCDSLKPISNNANSLVEKSSVKEIPQELHVPTLTPPRDIINPPSPKNTIAALSSAYYMGTVSLPSLPASANDFNIPNDVNIPTNVNIPLDSKPALLRLLKEKLEEKLECALCKQKFNTEDATRIHFLSHLDMDAKTCPICEETFTSYSEASSHFSYYYGEFNNYQCSHCPRSFYLKRTLDRHLEWKHPPT